MTARQRSIGPCRAVGWGSWWSAARWMSVRSVHGGVCTAIAMGDTLQWRSAAVAPSLISALRCRCRLCLCALRRCCSDYLFKLVLIGDSGVGKSCLLLRFAVRTQRHQPRPLQITPADWLWQSTSAWHNAGAGRWTDAHALEWTGMHYPALLCLL